MANLIETATLFQANLDKAAEQGLLTGFMEGNAGQVIYNGGSEDKIPKLSMDGLGNYDRDGGYAQGGVTLEYETRQMTYDRGRKFFLDPITINEANFVPTAANVMGEFQRLKVVPEIDAIRFAKLAQYAMGVASDEQAEYGYTPAKTTCITKLREGIRKVRKAGYNGNIVAYVTYDVLGFVEDFYGDKLMAQTFAIGGVDTRVPSVDGVPLIPVPDNRFFTKIKLKDGTSVGQTVGGFDIDGTDGKHINFLIVATEVPIAIQKTDTIRIFDPNTNQQANAWQLDYRKFHDIWVLDNKLNGLFVNIKETK